MPAPGARGHRQHRRHLVAQVDPARGAGCRRDEDLCVPDDPRGPQVGVCAHELGHLLFGWPDLYDTDDRRRVSGTGASWPAAAGTAAAISRRIPRPGARRSRDGSAVENLTENGTLDTHRRQDRRTVHRLWKDGTAGQEYFLVENRQQAGYDAGLPSAGLFAGTSTRASSRTRTRTTRVALMQADGPRDLENDVNRGDAGDPYPGYTGQPELRRQLRSRVDRLFGPGFAGRRHGHQRFRRHHDGDRLRAHRRADCSPGTSRGGSRTSRPGSPLSRTPCPRAARRCPRSVRVPASPQRSRAARGARPPVQRQAR